MGNKTKGPVMLLFFLLLVAIAAAVLGFIGLQKEKQINAALTQEKEEIEIKKKAAEKEVSNLKQQVGEQRQEIVQQQAKVQELNSRIASLDNELSAEKKAREDTFLEAEKLREEVITLKNARSKLEADLKASNETVDSLKSKLDLFESSQQKKKVEQTAQEAKPQDMQLEKIVIASRADVAQAPSAKPQVTAPQALLEGKVLVVNKEYDFVVVNIGQKDNLVIGDTLEIFRKEKKLGELKVEEVRDTMSVAIPVEPNLIKQLKEDDRVVRK